MAHHTEAKAELAEMRDEIKLLRVKAIMLLQRLEDGDDPQTAMDDLWNALGRKD